MASLSEQDQNSLSDLRRRAEQRLDKAGVKLTQLSAEEMMNLVHELQVHQIELELQNEELLHSEQKYQILNQRFVDLYDFAPFGYLVIDKPDRIRAANLNAARMLGINRSALIDRSLADFIPAEEQDHYFLAMRALFGDGLPQHYTLQLNPRPNKIITVKVDAYPEQEAPDRIVSCRLAMSDITALKQKEAELQEALAHLQETQQRLIQQERLAAVGQLAAGVAHDFNNILTAILGSAELILYSHQALDPSKKNAEAIVQASQRAASLVKQILDFSQKTVQHKRKGDLVPFLEEVIQFLTQTIPETIKFSLNVEPGRYWIEADFDQLHQMFINLVINSKDAMPQGGQISINLSQLEAAEAQKISLAGNQPFTSSWLCVEVRDTGHGIPAQHLAHIFEPFFTTKSVGKGVGLGLSQVHGIVNQHGWHLEVDSTENQGTSIKIYVSPVAVPHEKSEIQIPPPTAGQGARVLLVEDDSTVTQVISAMLNKLNYEVISVANGKEALKVYERYKDDIALVISDVVMPEMNGEALFGFLKAENPDLKMILMTGYSLNQKGVELLEQGIVAWVEKPVSLQRLSQAVNKALSEKDPG